jgi:hypothetical protein
MKRVFYAGGSFVTGDRTAQAVLDIAHALADREKATIIDIPVAVPHSDEARVQLLVGPASQLMVMSEAADVGDVDDEQTLASLARQVQGLLHPHARSVDDADVTGADIGGESIPADGDDGSR